MTNMPDTTTPVLQAGLHETLADGACLLEWCSHLAGEAFSDHPTCVSPIIACFGRSWNDVLDDEDRQSLLPLAPLLLHSATGPLDDEARVWLCIDWLIRVQCVAWMRLTPALVPHAELLAALEPQTSPQALLDSAGTRDDAGTAAWAGTAAGTAAWAGTAACASPACTKKNCCGSWDAAWCAAREGAKSSGLDAAGDAVRDETRDGDAARDAASTSLGAALVFARTHGEPRATVVALQRSALRLMADMAAVGR